MDHLKYGDLTIMKDFIVLPMRDMERNGKLWNRFYARVPWNEELTPAGTATTTRQQHPEGNGVDADPEPRGNGSSGTPPQPPAEDDATTESKTTRNVPTPEGLVQLTLGDVTIYYWPIPPFDLSKDGASTWLEWREIESDEGETLRVLTPRSKSINLEDAEKLELDLEIASHLDSKVWTRSLELKKIEEDLEEDFYAAEAAEAAEYAVTKAVVTATTNTGGSNSINDTTATAAPNDDTIITCINKTMETTKMKLYKELTRTLRRERTDTPEQERRKRQKRSELKKRIKEWMEGNKKRLLDHVILVANNIIAHHYWNHPKKKEESCSKHVYKYAITNPCFVNVRKYKDNATNTT